MCFLLRWYSEAGVDQSHSPCMAQSWKTPPWWMQISIIFIVVDIRPHLNVLVSVCTLYPALKRPRRRIQMWWISSPIFYLSCLHRQKGRDKKVRKKSKFFELKVLVIRYNALIRYCDLLLYRYVIEFYSKYTDTPIDWICIKWMNIKWQRWS